MVRSITRRSLLLGTSAAMAGAAFWPARSAPAGDTASSRTYHAVLVGVTAYPELPPVATLVGPNNDAALVRDFLRSSAPVTFEDGNITVLADGLEGAVSPTKQAIRDALAALAGTVANGDFVYLHFSGHGSQQPTIDPQNEVDGMDEIFLPRDTGMWVDRTKGVPNAYIDKEIRGDLKAIRDRGAFIWAVFDCCHSGTMTRDVSMMNEEVTERKLDFATLGIPEEEMAAAQAQAGATRGLGAGEPRQNALGFTGDAVATGAAAIAPGGMVAFFAAQTVETTPELPLPRGAEDATRLGLFTYTLFSKIAENPALSYRQLGQSVLQAYSAANRQRPTPLFEGDLDRPIFGTSIEEAIHQWPIRVSATGAEIPAGKLHRLAEGSRLAVLPSPASPIEDAVGYLEVAAAKNLTSRLVPVEHEGMPAPSLADLPPNAYARLTELAIEFELVVARPGGEGEFAEETAMVNALLDRIVEEETSPVNLRFVAANDPADLRIAVMSETDVGIMIADQRRGEEVAAARASLSTEPRIWLLPPSAELSLEPGYRPPSIPIGDGSAEDILARLSESLVMIFRATNLSRLAAASDFRPEEVSVGFNILRAETGVLEPLQPATVPRVHPDDQVHIEARNASSKPVDINVLYVGSDYSISHMYAERLHGGAELDLPLLAFTDSSFGIERMIVVLSEAKPQTPVEDLSFLQQIGVRAVSPAGGGNAGFGDLLRDIAAAPETRSAARIGQTSAARGGVMIFSMETMPRA